MEDLRIRKQWNFLGVIETPDFSEPYYTGPEIQVLDMGNPKYDQEGEKEKEYYEA